MSRRKLKLGSALLIAAGVLCYFFPLFHIRSLSSDIADSEVQSAEQEIVKSDPAAFVRELWDSPKRQGEGAIAVSEFWKAYYLDSETTEKEYGRQVGLGGAWYFCVRGQGKIAEIKKNSCLIDVTDTDQQVEIKLGVIVDNTVREALGINVNNFANSQDFNAVSSELNLRVENEVIQPIREQLQAGKTIRFVGCTKVSRLKDLEPLNLIPLWLEIEETSGEATPAEESE